MICLLEERVCNLVLLWCITVIAHHCKLVKLQSSISDYRSSDLWSYDDIEVARPQNESTIRLVKNHHGEAYYVNSDDRKITRHNDQDLSDDLPSLRNRDHFGSRTNIEIPIGPKSNDGEISISKKITFNGGNNSRSNNYPLWFNALEKSAMSLPASISFNLKNLYGERKSESTKRPYENPGIIFASKTAPLNNTGFNRNKMKYQQQPNYEPEYEETGLPPSLPNLEIIPFVASDALDKPKETPADRKEGIEYVEDETTPLDPAAMIKKFSPPVLTEGGFVPRDPTLDELYYEAKFNHTYSTPPHIMLTEITSEYRVTELAPKVPEIASENVQLQYIEYTPSSPFTTHKSTTTTPTTTATRTTPTPTPIFTTTTTTTTEASSTSAVPPTPVIHFITTKAVNYSMLTPLLKHISTSTTNFTTTTSSTTTTEDPSIEESEEGEEEESEGVEEETIPLTESEPLNNESAVNNTKEEPTEPEDNSLLSNILTMIFDDYPAPNKGKTTVPPPTSKKSTSAVKSTTPTIRLSSTSFPPFKHVYIPPSTTTTTTTTTTEISSTVKNMDKMGFISTKFSNNNTSTSMNETQQNQIKYVSLPQTFTYNQPVPKTTPRSIIKERPQSHNEIYHSMKSDNVISGLLKLSGCNIFGKMYKTGEQIEELTEPCSRCICSEAGVHCIQTKC